LKVKYADFQQITRSRSSVGPIPSQVVLERICKELVESLFPLAKGVRLLGVSLSNLSNGQEAGRQLTLRF
jgi:DNA polymerase-4